MKQAAQSLYRLETAANKRQRVDTPAAASAHLDSAQKKCDEINAELWKLSASSMEIERRLLIHNAAVLGLGMNILEKKAMETGITDDFGEGHLYISNDNGERPSSRRSSARLSISERTPPQQITTPPPELTEAQRRLRELNYQVATMIQPEISPPTPSSENILTLIESLDTHIRRLADSHTDLTRDLQTSVSESQRMVEQLKLRERDQSAAIADHTSRTEDLDRRLVQTQREFDRVQNELEEREGVIINLRKDMQTAREEARIAREEARIVETAAQGREAESLHREKTLRREEFERFKAELAQKNTDITDLTQDVTSLRSQAEQSSSQAKALEMKLEEQSCEHDVLVRDLETQLVMLKSETAMLKAEKDEILGSRQQRAQEAKLQRELEQQREKLSRNSHAEDLLLAEIETLKESNAQLSQDLDRLKSEHAAKQDSLNFQIASLEGQLSTTSKDDRSSDVSVDSSRERELEARCDDLQAELAFILDDFERLTSQFIDHESFRSTLEAQVDALRAQCHDLQTELAEQKVRTLGQLNNDNSSPVPGGRGQTLTVTLRAEFRKMVAELRKEHIAALTVSQESVQQLIVG